MWEKVKQFLASPSFPLNEDKTWAARLLNGILWVIFTISVIGSVVMTVLNPAAALFNILSGLFLVVVIVAGKIWLRRGYVRLVGGGVTVLLWLVITFLVSQSAGLRSPMIVAYYLILIVAGAVVGSKSVLPMGILNLVVGLALYIGENQGWFASLNDLPTSFTEWVVYAIMMSLSALLLWMGLRDVELWIQRSLAGERTLAERNTELYTQQEELLVYTHNVERRFGYLEAVARITQALGTFLDSGELFAQLAQTVATELHFEHVAVYEVSVDRLHAQLKAVSSAQHLVTQDYTLSLSETPSFEHVVWRVEPYIYSAGVPGVGQAVVQEGPFLSHPEWPIKRSALLFPLRNAQSRSVFGVLELATSQERAFDVQDTVVLQALADQIALMIGNAQLFAELQSNLVMATQSSENVSREMWGQLLDSKARRVYRYSEGQADVRSGTAGARSGTAGGELPTLSVPLRVRGQVLGKLVAHKSNEHGDWTSEESAIMNTLLAQLEQALDSARMYNVTQRRAMRERVTRELTAHIRSSLTVEEAMRRAVREVSRVLRASETVARLGTEQTLLQEQLAGDIGDAHE